MRKKSKPQVGPPADGPHRRLFDKIVDMNSEQDVRDVLRRRHTMDEEMQRTVDKAMKHRQQMKDKTWGRSPSAPRPRAKPKQTGMDSYVARRTLSPPGRARPGPARPPSAAAAAAEPSAAPADPPDLGLKSTTSLVENRQKLYTAVANNRVSGEEAKAVVETFKWKWKGSDAVGQINSLLQYADELKTKHFAPRAAPSPRRGATSGGSPSDRKRKGLDPTASECRGRGAGRGARGRRLTLGAFACAQTSGTGGRSRPPAPRTGRRSRRRTSSPRPSGGGSRLSSLRTRWSPRARWICSRTCR